MASTQIQDTYCFHALYVQELEKGNAATTDHFVSYFRPRLRSLLRKNGIPSDSVEDIQQETFVRVLAVLRAKGIRHPERLGGFVNAVCRNALFESYRSAKRYVEIGDSMYELPNAGPDADAMVLKTESAMLVRRVLSRLSFRDQRLLCSLLIEQRSKAEICEELGVSRGHLRLLLYRAKRRFVDHMSQDEQQHLRDGAKKRNRQNALSLIGHRRS